MDNLDEMFVKHLSNLTSEEQELTEKLIDNIIRISAFAEVKVLTPSTNVITS